MNPMLLVALILSGACLSFPAAALPLAVASPAPQKSSQSGGRYDEQIRARVQQILNRERRYTNVKADVEDSVITLTGSVELDSSRRSLVDRMRRIPHVESVQNQLVLDPPAVPDKELYGRVQRNLEDAGYRALTFKVHEGAVILEGMVADEQARQRVIDLVRRIEGVKEVDARLSFASH
jgi:osmotically-inducible protein OsmY